MGAVQMVFGDKGEFERVTATIEIFGEKLETVGLAIKHVLGEYEQLVQEAFDSEAGMDGRGWNELSEWAQKDRAKMGAGSVGPKLQRTGELYRAYTNCLLTHYEEAGAATRVAFIDIQAISPVNGGNYAPTMAYGMDPNPLDRGSGSPRAIPARPVLPDGMMMTAMLARAVNGYLTNPSISTADMQVGRTYQNSPQFTSTGFLGSTGLKEANYTAYDRIARTA